MHLHKIALYLKLLPVYACIGIVIFVAVNDSPKKINVPQPIHAQSAQEVVQKQKPAAPIVVMVPKLHIEASVKPGSYDAVSKTWSLSNDSAYFASSTTLLNNERGTTVIYAHNSKALFGSLKKLEIGESVYIAGDDGRVFEYALTGHQTVLPTDTSVLIPEESPTLVLLTCTGLRNEKRLISRFSLKNIYG